ncbi:hypothetical protein LTR62_006850 [Meristemomyces frigidus]|uniref:Uncharacterized protein n=1 Tax=Meristemomyces frigidus TaxID=1508187 RepID=A0AAN7TCG4_9PEZI|nr:hypothetical protein LTR62_006850 [Meristemomyces frigidus]
MVTARVSDLFIEEVGVPFEIREVEGQEVIYDVGRRREIVVPVVEKVREVRVGEELRGEKTVEKGREEKLGGEKAREEKPKEEKSTAPRPSKQVDGLLKGPAASAVKSNTTPASRGVPVVTAGAKVGR